jgi:uncharacterized protein (TIGR02145 family)
MLFRLDYLFLILAINKGSIMREQLPWLFFIFLIPVLLLLKACEKEELPKLTTLPIVQVSSSHVFSGGKITNDGNAPVSQRGVVWSTTSSPTTESGLGKTIDGGGMGEFTSEITNLTPGTRYYIRAYAINSQGTAYGNELEFTTSIDLPGLTTSGISEITSGSAKGGGSITNNGGAEILAKGIVWHTIANPSLENNTGKAESANGTGSFECELSDLMPGTTYFVRAFATNEEGVAYGDQVEFTTLAVLPSVVTGQVSNLKTDSAAVTGYVLDEGGAVVTIKGIVYGVAENPSLENNLSSVSMGAGMGEFTAVLSGLTPATAYFARAYAVNSVGTSYGEQIKFTTLQAIYPPTVITAQITGINHNSAVGGGNVTESGGAAVFERGMVYSKSPNPTTADSVVNSRRGTGTYISYLQNLDPRTTYYTRAFASNSAGTSYGEQVEFTTTSEFGQPCPGLPTVKDIEGNVYNTVMVGNQCWIKENLRTSTYKTGVPIIDGSDGQIWATNTTGAYAWYNNNAEEGKDYGVIYNWYAVNTGNLCPAGWWVPSDSDWTELTDYLINTFEEINDENVGNKLRSCRQIDSPMGGDCDVTAHPRWDSQAEHYGTNDFGFSALPGGSRNYTGNYFYGLGIIGYWWSSTEVDAGTARYRRIYHDSGKFHRLLYHKGNGYMVRCVKK